MLILDDDARRRAYFLQAGHDVVGTMEDFKANAGRYDHVSLDYDLYREGFNKGLDGKDAAKWLASSGWKGRVTIHSHNAKGAMKIAIVLTKARIKFKIRPFPVGV